ncbi:MAG: DUF3078 domain-containing protein [Bacteroidota bacterium]|nr:DUF3078 domain-containing protein [Bacteroidota bacterium]
MKKLLFHILMMMLCCGGTHKLMAFNTQGEEELNLAKSNFSICKKMPANPKAFFIFSTLTDTSKSEEIKNWVLGGTGGVNFSQGYLSYWAEGGESSISGLAFFNLFFNYQKGNSKWENKLNSKYGLLKSGENKLRKNEDNFDISSKFGQKAYRNFYYSVLVSLKSQMDKGYKFPNDSVVVSAFLSPGYITTSIGMDYKPTNNLSILLSPLTSKITVMRDTSINETKYGLDEGTSHKKEMGAFLKTIYKIDITKDITLENELDFFTNYRDNPENIDVNWEVKLTMKVNDHINTTIQTHLIYDDDIKLPIERTRIGESGLEETYMGNTKKVQFKEMLSVGFSYRF